MLVSGYTEDGLRTLGSLLPAIGLKLPTTAMRAIPGLLYDRLRLRLHSTNLSESNTAEISIAALSRADVCWSVAQGLAMVDPIRAARFHARHFLLARRAGDIYRLSRALAMEAGYSALSGSRTTGKADTTLRHAAELAAQCAHPQAAAFVAVVRGMAAFLEGRFRAACDALYGAEKVMRENCVDVAWELATARLVGCVSLFFLGELKNLSARLPELLENAQGRGDLYESTDLRIRIAA